MVKFLSRLSAFILSMGVAVGVWAGIPTGAQAAVQVQPASFASLEGVANYPTSAFQLAEAALEAPAVTDDAAEATAAQEAKEAAKAAEKEAKKLAKAEAKKLKLAAKEEAKKLKLEKEAEKDAAKAEAKKLKLAAKEEAQKLKEAEKAAVKPSEAAEAATPAS